MSDRNRNTNNDFDFGDEDDFFGRDDDRSSLPDEDFGPDFGDEGMRDDLPEIDEPPAERGGGNRTFIILAAVMILLFLLGLGAILFLALRPQPITPEALTATAITDQNATIIAFGNLTATQSVIDAQATATAAVFVQQTADAGLLLTQTQAAEDAAATQTASVPTITPTPTEDPTLIAATQQIFATQTQLAIDGENAQNTATA
ncbi:MAG: hypothetical protein SF123_17490, partial [Chloroflexota bacterium]|nr:hypothetical protein [Chloroflexota bacterium]